MGEPDDPMMFRGELLLRFDVARQVAIEFIEGDGKDLKGRPNDLIGLTTFARYPEANFPFTLYHDSLVDGLKRTGPMEPMLTSIGKQTRDQRQAGIERDRFGRQFYRRNPLDGTELQAAIAYGANQLISLGDDIGRGNGDARKYNVKSKVMVLLTDGLTEQNFADPETIKKLRDEDIKVYVVQILSNQRFRRRSDGTIEVVTQDQPRRSNDLFSLFGRNPFAQQQDRQLEATVNEAIERSRRLAAETGGTHFLATTGDELHEVYAQIDEMEQSDVGRRTVFSREEVYRPYLFAALALLVGEVVLGLTWLRRVP
jgi:Ca-activated chloride channel family protein